MKKVMWVFGVLILLSMLAGCASDPRSAADANATNLRAQQDALDQQAARQQKIDEQGLIMAEKQAESAQWVGSWNSFVSWTMLFVTISCAMVILSTGTGVSWAVIGIGRATAFAVLMRARHIPLDEKTGHYPLLTYEGKGIVTLTDINTGQTLQLDTRNAADRQMIAGAMALRLGGVVSRNARMSGNNASGVAMVGTHPVVIGAKDGSLNVGEYMTMEEDHAAN